MVKIRNIYSEENPIITLYKDDVRRDWRTFKKLTFVELFRAREIRVPLPLKLTEIGLAFDGLARAENLPRIPGTSIRPVFIPHYFSLKENRIGETY